jgi:hypothetical protein
VLVLHIVFDRSLKEVFSAIWQRFGWLVFVEDLRKPADILVVHQLLEPLVGKLGLPFQHLQPVAEARCKQIALRSAESRIVGRRLCHGWNDEQSSRDPYHRDKENQHRSDRHRQSEGLPAMVAGNRPKVEHEMTWQMKKVVS